MSKSPEDLLCAAAASGDTDAVKSLLSSGADPSHFDSSGLTPLMHAALHNRSAAADLLLSAGAPWNALSPSGLSAGDFALQHSHQETLDLLLNFAIQSELIFNTIARQNQDPGSQEKKYLEERIEFGEGRLMDSESKAVMMAWEGPLMEAHARAVCSNGGRVLNVGFGMGMVDEAIQKYEGVTEHTIVEAHPEVYDRMMKSGWGEKSNVKVVFGRWQDVISQLGSFDGKDFDA